MGQGGGREGGEGGGDQTSVGPVVVLGHEGGSSTRAEGSEVDGGHQDTLDVGAWCQREQCGFDLAGDEGGGGRRGGGGKGGEMGGHQQCGVHWFHLLSSLKNGLIWRWGGAVWGATRGALVPPFGFP